MTDQQYTSIKFCILNLYLGAAFILISTYYFFSSQHTCIGVKKTKFMCVLYFGLSCHPFFTELNGYNEYCEYVYSVKESYKQLYVEKYLEFTKNYFIYGKLVR
jgi:hypothetical protein